MLAILKGIPFCFSLLMEIFKTREGGNVKPATKLIVLSFAAFLTYSTYITLIYIEQYQILIKYQVHVEYLRRTVFNEYDISVALRADNRELERMLRQYRVPPPSYNQLPEPPEAPLGTGTTPNPELDPLIGPRNLPYGTLPSFKDPVSGMLSAPKTLEPLIQEAEKSAVMFRRRKEEEGK